MDGPKKVPKPKKMSPFVIGLIVAAAIGALIGLYFLVDHLLSDNTVKPTNCKKASDCTGTTRHCQSNKCVQCVTNSHCGGSTPRCNNGVCAAALGCSADSECKLGEKCDGGKCVLIPCTATSGCDAPLVCKDGKCALECSQNSQCNVDEECKENRCAVKACSNNAECTAPRMCIEGHCKLQCAVDAECPAGTICDQGRCEKDFTCSKQSDCQPGEVCSQGSCSRTCFDNKVCPAGSECIGGLCVRTKLPCPTGSSLARGVCVKKPCTSDGECGDKRCDRGLCEPVCQSDSNCPAGAQCREGKCITNKLLCKFNAWDGRRPTNDMKYCAWIFDAPSKTAPRAADPRFLMYEGEDTWVPCLKKCISHPECSMAWFDNKTDSNTCRIYSKGVNTSTVSHPTGTLARKVYQLANTSAASRGP